MPRPEPDGIASSSAVSTILVVDDEKGPRESLRMILSAEHRILIATCAAEALDILRTTAVDLATVDLNMPGMRGDELMRTIRSQHPHVEVIVITGCGSVETAVEGIRYGVSDYLSKPFDVVQVTAAVSRALKRQHSRHRLIGFLQGIGKLLGTDRDAEEMLADLDQSTHLQRRLRGLLDEPALDPSASRTQLADPRAVEFLEVLAETIESRDACMRGHARRTAFYAGLLAERAELDAETIATVRLSAFLHDLGKVGVAAATIQSRSPLSDADRSAIALHSSIGERLIRPLGLSGSVASAIRHHHERWDGNGYPDGLQGDASPTASRIIAVADAFDAMTCERPYRSALSTDDAVAELQKHAGSQFDPQLAEQFSELVESGSFELSPDSPAIGGAPTKPSA